MHLKEIRREARTGLISLKIEKKIADCCVHGNELFVSVKAELLLGCQEGLLLHGLSVKLMFFSSSGISFVTYKAPGDDQGSCGLILHKIHVFP